MGFRFRRSIGLLPGVRINLGRRGASVSLGVRGAHVTVGRTGIRNTVGIPGTGMSYTSNTSWGEATKSGEPLSPPVPQPTNTSTSSLGWVVAAALFIVLVAVIASR